MRDGDDELLESDCIEHCGQSDSGAPWGNKTVLFLRSPELLQKPERPLSFIPPHKRDLKVLDANTDSAVTQRGSGGQFGGKTRWD